MIRASLQSLAVAALAAITLTASAEAVTPITGCGTLDKPGETYVLTTDISTNGANICFGVTADRITLDLAGHTISKLNSSDDSRGIVVNQSQSVAVKNGTVHNFRDGIVFQGSPRATIRNVTVSDSGLAGILVFNGSPNGLVKDCTVTGTLGIGVVVDNNSQVEGCLVEGSFRIGIRALDRALVTKNIVRGNGWTKELLFKSGIQVGASGTVTHNTATNNFGDGILVGPKSLVTYNTANDNRDNGIEAECPSTITNNEALGNGGLPIKTIGNGCAFGNAGNVTSSDPT